MHFFEIGASLLFIMIGFNSNLANACNLPSGTVEELIIPNHVLRNFGPLNPQHRILVTPSADCKTVRISTSIEGEAELPPWFVKKRCEDRGNPSPKITSCFFDFQILPKPKRTEILSIPYAYINGADLITVIPTRFGDQKTKYRNLSGKILRTPLTPPYVLYDNIVQAIAEAREPEVQVEVQVYDIFRISGKQQEQEERNLPLNGEIQFRPIGAPDFTFEKIN